jgi:Copper type II ascorbate-dependent monooxygenase, C-terminal domain
MKAVLVALVALAACKSDTPETPDAGPDANPTADGWTPLLGRSWTLAPGATNTYKCTRIKVANDMWIAGFRAASPLGTHHSVLTISTVSLQTGDYDCGPGSLDTQMLYAAGVGTDDLLFPPGVAMHLPAGTYINLNLHLFNATDNPLADTSGVMVKVVQQADVQHEADMMFSGTFSISIDNDGMPHTAGGGCTAPSDWHIFTLWPHMHQTAVHQTWSYTHASVTTSLIDDDFLFDEQRNYPITDTLIHKGDRIQTVCTYVNNTKSVMTWGDGSDKEMCFTGMYKYPAGGGLFQCVGGSQPLPAP